MSIARDQRHLPPRSVLVLVTAAVRLCGLWLLASSSARRSELIEPRRDRAETPAAARTSASTRGCAHPAGRRPGRTASLGGSRAQRGSVPADRRRDRRSATFVIVAALFPRAARGRSAPRLRWWACFAWLDHRLDKRRRGVHRPAARGRAVCFRTAPRPGCRSRRRSSSPSARSSRRRARSSRPCSTSCRWAGSLADSLDRLRRRLPSREIAVLMTTLIVQQRSGGDAVSALHELSETLDSRRETQP